MVALFSSLALDLISFYPILLIITSYTLVLSKRCIRSKRSTNHKKIF